MSTEADIIGREDRPRGERAPQAGSPALDATAQSVAPNSAVNATHPAAPARSAADHVGAHIAGSLPVWPWVIPARWVAIRDALWTPLQVWLVARLVLVVISALTGSLFSDVPGHDHSLAALW